MTVWGFTGGWRRAGIASLLLLVAMLAAVVLRMHWDAETLAAEAGIEQARARAMELAATQKGTRQTEQGPLSDPWDGLPAASAHAARLARLLDLGSKAGLQPGRVDQAPVNSPSGRVEQFQVNISFQGPYPAVRAFIEAALATDAALSLDRLRLSRVSPDAPVVEAETSWSFVQRHDKPSRGVQR